MNSRFCIGVRAHDFGRHEPEEMADIVSNHGFAAVQLALKKALPSYPGVPGRSELPGRLSPGFARSVRRCLEARGISIAVLGCYINPVSSDLESRDRELALFEEHLSLARDFGCSVVGTETGTVTPDYSRSESTFSEEAFGELVGSVRRLVETAEKFGVLVGVEGVADKHTINTHQKMVRLLESVNSPNLGVIYDPVNFLPSQRIEDQDALIEEAFSLFGDRILAVHAKDFQPDNGAKSAALPAGTGALNYPLLLSLLRRHKPGIDILLEDVEPATVGDSIRFVRDVEARL